MIQEARRDEFRQYILKGPLGSLGPHTQNLNVQLF